jgi:hypothetical protein
LHVVETDNYPVEVGRKTGHSLSFEENRGFSPALNDNQGNNKISHFHGTSPFGGFIADIVGVFIYQYKHSHNQRHIQYNLYAVFVKRDEVAPQAVLHDNGYCPFCYVCI